MSEGHCKVKILCATDIVDGGCVPGDAWLPRQGNRWTSGIKVELLKCHHLTHNHQVSPGSIQLIY